MGAYPITSATTSPPTQALLLRSLRVGLRMVIVCGLMILGPRPITSPETSLNTMPKMRPTESLTWQLHQAEEREAAQEAWETEGHVFTMEDGRPLNPAYVTRLFQKIRRQGELLPELTFHGLRHCAGSLWLASGVDISIVSKLLGHSSISVTADIYAHMLKGVGQQAVDGAAALISLVKFRYPLDK
jgi:Phage integrase family